MKPILLLVVLFTTPLWAFTQEPGHISGKVTFVFNKFQGEQPDNGAKVYILDSASAGNFSMDLADSFYYAAFYLGLQREYLDNHQDLPDNLQESIEKSGAGNQKVFDDMDRRNASQLFDLVANANIRSVAANDAGAYSYPLAAGTYYILIQSNGRTGMNTTENQGMVRVRKVKIVNGQVVDFSCKFGPY